MFAQIKRSEDYAEFINMCEKRIGVRFPESYLSENRVVAYFENSKMMGGFIVATSGKLRSLEGIPQGQIPHSLLILLEQDDIFEVNGLWLAPSIKGWKRGRFWFELYRNIFKVQRSYLVFSYSLSKPKLGKLYQIANPTVVYRGPFFMDGMSEADEESVEICSIANVRKTWIRHIFLRTVTKKRATWAHARTST